ncbi:hypothetical protein CF111_12200 [Aeromonas sobria]|uniref:hypothetical protein n=1 Tax=Aeromonas sobria TaxID=646 RepID=UPI00111B14ED|nr:hypothetical protein [Aeromonas sobria]TNJ22030.1 hypothetical protein CF111_12200 [Aeromonas sobria]
MKIEQAAPLTTIATSPRPQGSPIGRLVSQFRNLTAPAAERTELTLPTPPALTTDSQQLLIRELRKGISSYLVQHPEQQTALDELLSAGQMRNELGKPTLATAAPLPHLVTLLNQLKKLPDGKALTKALVKDPAGEVGRYITLKGSFGSKSCQLRSQPLAPRSLSEPELLQLAPELKQVLQHYLDADPAKSERHTAYLRDYLQQPEIGRYLGLLDTPNGSQVKINALPSRKEEIANLMNRLLAGHGRGALYHAFAHESGREGILGRHFKLEGRLEFSFAVRAEPLPPAAVATPSPAPSDESHRSAPDPMREQQRAAQLRQQEALEHLKLEQEITRQLANRPVYQTLANLTRAAANLQVELDGQHLPPADPIPATRIDLNTLTHLALPQVRELSAQLREENNRYLQQVEAHTQHLPTDSDANRFSPHIIDMLGITLTQPYFKVLDDSIQALRQPAPSRTTRLLGWLLPAQAKARQLKQEQSIGRLHELRQVIAMLQLQGGSWQGIDRSGWAKQLLGRTLEQAMPTPWQLGPFRINEGRNPWQARLSEWGISAAKG